MKTTTNAIVIHTNHCRRLIAISRPPAQTPLLGFPPREDSTRPDDLRSTCTFVCKHLREFPGPQEWRNSGLTEPHNATVPPLAPEAKSLVSALDQRVRQAP